MNPENLKFLQDRLFYLGTEKKLHEDLAKNIAEGKPEFTLGYSVHHGEDKFSANFHFRKSDQADMYFVNRFDANLQKPAQEGLSKTFYLDNGKGVTMKEAYNLLDGRAVNKDLKNKEGVVYNAWMKLDYTNKDDHGQPKIQQYHKNYGFDLQTELFRLPVSHLPSEQFSQMAVSLERGNLYQLKMPEHINNGQAILISANPQFKTIDLFDEKGRPLSRDEKKEVYVQAEQQKNDLDKGVAAKLSKAPEAAKAVSELKEQEKSSLLPKNEKKSSVKTTSKEKSDSLLPKKRESKSKGMSI